MKARRGERGLIIGLMVLALALGGYIWYLKAQPAPQAAKTTQGSPTPAAGVATATPVETPTPTPAIGRCHTADLSATLKASDSAAGTSYQTLGLVNKSGHTCWVYGFPGISLLDASGKQLGQPAARSGAATTTVTLLAGGSAYSTLGFPNPGNFDPGTCSAQSTSLNIYPPDETAAIVVADGKQACPGFSVTALSPTAP